MFGRKKSLLHRLGQVTSPKVILPLAIAVGVLFRKNPRARLIPIGTALAVGATNLIKLGVDERRPGLFCKEEWSSFPSGHSAATAALFLGVAHLTGRPIAYVAAAGASVAVNTLRVETRKHWPHDVIVGDLVGWLALALATGVDRHLPPARHLLQQGAS